jgi:PAS domain S-box-containing protein
MNEKNETLVLLNVLSLEDSEIDFEIISEQLIKANYNLKIVRVEEEWEFISLIRDNNYDIILADYSLPQFDAFEALRLCRIYCPDVPFICVSGSIGEITAIELLKMGAVDYVLKDRMERLPFAVQRALNETKEKEEKKQVELSLHNSEEKYRTIFENVHDVFYQIDLDGIIREISPSVIFFSEFNRTELLGKSVYGLFANAFERDKLFRQIQENGEVRDYEIDIKIKIGEIKYASVNARLIYNDGKPDHIDGSMRDITERKHAEVVIRQSEANLNYAQELAKMGSWDLDVLTNKYSWSKNMYKLLGYEPFIIEATYLDFLARVHPDDKHLVDIYRQEMISTKNPVSYDLRYVFPDDKLIWVQNSITPVFENDRLIELRGINIDITEKKLAEQELIKAKAKAEASDRLKTAFMNNISHEIRTPLNGIIGFSQILTDPNFSTDEKEEHCKMLNESSDRLLNTITNIMDISLLTSGNLKVVKTEIALMELISEVCEKFSLSCQQRKITIFGPGPHLKRNYKIFTDRELLGKILHQLIDNAVKFTVNGTIDVGFEKKENKMQFFVRDTGIGISDENKNHIFENFIQGDIANSRKYEGTGIGLSIAKGYVELLGGKIWLDSEKGKGSTFFFFLPAA